MLIQTHHVDHVFKLHVLKHQHCKQTIHVENKGWSEQLQQSKPDPTGKADPVKEEMTSVYLYLCLSLCTIHKYLLLSHPRIMPESWTLCFVSSDFSVDTGR